MGDVILALIAALLFAWIFAEVFGAIDPIANWLIHRAARFLPRRHQARYEEEWLAFLAEFHSPTRKSIHALSTILTAPIAAARLRRADVYETIKQWREKANDLRRIAEGQADGSQERRFFSVLVRLYELLLAEFSDISGQPSRRTGILSFLAFPIAERGRRTLFNKLQESRDLAEEMKASAQTEKVLLGRLFLVVINDFEKAYYGREFAGFVIGNLRRFLRQ